MDNATQHRLPDRGRLAGLAWKAPTGLATGMPGSLRCIRLALVPARPSA